jgi:hypothetical protein
MLHTRVVAVFMMVAITFCVAQEVMAIGPVVVPYSEFAVIAPDTGAMNPRVLLTFRLPDALSDVEIDDAHLRFSARVDVPLFVPTGQTLLRCSAISTAWAPSTVGWDFPWDSPGGVLDQASLRNAVVARGEHTEVRIRVADILQYWIDNPSRNFGLAVACADEVPGGLLVSLPGEGSRGDTPSIEIHYSLRDR